MDRVNLEMEIKKLIGNYPTELPDMVRDRIDKTLASLPTIPSKRTKGLARKMTLASAVAAILGVSLLGCGFVSPAMAQTLRQIPLIESVFKIAGDLGLQTAEEKNLTTPINQSITLNGVTVSISEVFYDGSRLTIGLLQHSPDGIKEILEVEPVINGKSEHFAGSSTDMSNITDNKTVATLVQFLPGEKLPDSFDLQLLVFLKGMENNRFEFNFPVRKTSSGSRIVNPIVTKAYGDTTITVQKIQMTPSTTQLVMDIKLPAWKETVAPRYALFDDRGIMLQTLHENGRSEKIDNMMNLTTKTQFAPFQTIPKFVIIKPYVDEVKLKVGENSAVMDHMPSTESPIILDQGELGQLEITKVEKYSDKTFVHYRAVGDDPFRRVFWIKGEAGTKIIHTGFRVKDPEKYEFVVEFPALKSDQTITFVTDEYPKTDYIKELEVTIPIDQ
ncbi:MAG: DUF4179 domain-containing protein [Bacillota bacterium]